MFSRVLSAAAILLLLSMGAFAQSQTVQVAGVSRNYILHAPAALADNPPLVFVIHGFNMTGQQEVSLTRMNQVADREKFIVVYPNALPNGSNQQSWDLAGPNDFAFLMAIINAVDEKHKIDRNRVYASGFSQGGFLSFQLGCRHADVFAAIAPVSGLLRDPGTCAPKRPVPMIFTFGTNEGFDVNGFIKSGEDWAKLNGCGSTPAVQKPYPAANPNSVVTRSTYSGCKEGAEVVVQSVEGGGHEWPMNTQTKVNNSEEVWAFFKKHSLPEATEVRPRPGMAGPSLHRAVYAQGRVRLAGLSGLSGRTPVRVLDTQGRVVADEVAVHGEFAFADKPAGIYQVLAGPAGSAAPLRFAVP